MADRRAPGRRPATSQPPRRRSGTPRAASAPSEQATAPPGAPWRIRAATLAIVVAGAWAYATSFAGVFVFDDRPAIVDNTTIRRLRLPEVLTPPPHATVSGRPVANLTFALNYAAANEPSPQDPWGYHAVNLAIHLAAALALFGVVRRTCESPALRGVGAAVAPWLGAATALLWVVHPLTTGAVTYVVQRVESLMALCYLLTIYCAIRAATAASRRRAWSAAAIAACALGLGVKEAMVSAPIVVWLWDVVFLRAEWRPWANRERWGLYLGLASTWGVTAALMSGESQARLVIDELARFGTTEGWTPWQYLWTQAGVLAHYLRLAVVPAPLVFDYYGWPRVSSPMDVPIPAALIVTLVAVTVVGLVRRHPAGFAGAVCFAVLAPTSSVLPIPTEIAAEHRMYLPLAALVGGSVAAAAVAGRRLPARARTPAAAIVVSALVLTLGAATRARNRDYGSDERLWADTVAKRPDNARARFNYGINLVATGRYAEAEAQMRAAVSLPADAATRAQIHLQLGSALAAQGKLADGIAEISRALTIDPSISEADAMLGQAYVDAGDPVRGLQHYKRALERQPDNPLILRRVAWLAATSASPSDDDRRLAIAAGERGVQLTGGEHVTALEALAAAYARSGRMSEALATARRALALSEARGDGAAARLRTQIALYQRGS